jgi:hypothetical protein
MIRHDIEQRDSVPLIGAFADGDQPAEFVAVECHRDDIDEYSDNTTLEREPCRVLEGLTERPQLLTVAVRIDGDLLDQLVDGVAHPHDATSSGQWHRGPRCGMRWLGAETDVDARVPHCC